MDNVRSRWIIAIALVFMALTLAFSYFGSTQSGGSAGFQGLAATVAAMVSIVTLLLPIMSLMLSYAAIAGEVEQGSMGLLLSMPVTRSEVFLGKFIGLGGVVTLALVAGLGASAAVIVAAAGAEGLPGYLAFVGLSVLFALAYVSVGLFFSTLTTKRSTALSLAVIVWFVFNIVYDLVLIGVFVLGGGSINFGPGGPTVLPDWMTVAQLVSPGDALAIAATTMLGVTDFGLSYPAWVQPAHSALSLTLWALVPLFLGLWRLERLDL